jgi:hypothetical protein
VQHPCCSPKDGAHPTLALLARHICSGSLRPFERRIPAASALRIVWVNQMPALHLRPAMQATNFIATTGISEAMASATATFHRKRSKDCHFPRGSLQKGRVDFTPFLANAERIVRLQSGDAASSDGGNSLCKSKYYPYQKCTGVSHSTDFPLRAVPEDTPFRM